MLFEEFCSLNWPEQRELLKKWKLHRKWELTKLNDVLSFPALQQRLRVVEFEDLKVFIDAKLSPRAMLYYVKNVCHGPGSPRSALILNISVLIENCFNNYETFFLLSSSNGRVGKRSPISRLPNELFYRVIELFLTK